MAEGVFNRSLFRHIQEEGTVEGNHPAEDSPEEEGRLAEGGSCRPC